MPSITLDETVLKSLIDLVVIRDRLAYSLVMNPSALANRIAEARRSYSAGIEQNLAPYRSISVIDKVVREYEGLVRTSDKAIGALEGLSERLD